LIRHERPLEFLILGPFEVVRNGEPLEVPAGKPRASSDAVELHRAAADV